jgi:hypothetical protein
MLNKLMALMSLTLFITSQAFGYGQGIISHPLRIKDKMVTTEFTGILSNGTGLGMQARFTQKIDPKLVLEAGAGVQDGERNNTLFISADYTFLPDYGRQPRFSLKSTLETAHEFNSRMTNLSLTPIFSKGFNFWGKEAHPYISMPFGISLDSAANKYSITTALSLGMTGRLPFDGFKKLVANLETKYNIKNAYSAVFMGFSYLID